MARPMSIVRVQVSPNNKKRAVRLAQLADRVLRVCDEFDTVLEVEKARAVGGKEGLLDEMAQLGASYDVLDQFKDVCDIVLTLLNNHKQDDLQPDKPARITTGDITQAKVRNPL